MLVFNGSIGIVCVLWSWWEWECSEKERLIWEGGLRFGHAMEWNGCEIDIWWLDLGEWHCVVDQLAGWDGQPSKLQQVGGYK